MLVTSLSQLHPAMFSEMPCATERIGLVVAAGAAAGCMDLVWGLQRLIHEWYRHTPCTRSAVRGGSANAHHATSSQTTAIQ
jgi:hypothetical protein